MYTVTSACRQQEFELINVQRWARASNLTPNHFKFSETVFSNTRNECETSPPAINGITRVTIKKILSVMISSHLALSEHINQVVISCAQTFYAIRVLKVRRMNHSSLQIIFKSVIFAKIKHASSAWWIFPSWNGRSRADGFLNHCKHAGVFSWECQAVQRCASLLIITVQNNTFKPCTCYT